MRPIHNLRGRPDAAADSFLVLASWPPGDHGPTLSLPGGRQNTRIIDVFGLFLRRPCSSCILYSPALIPMRLSGIPSGLIDRARSTTLHPLQLHYSGQTSPLYRPISRL